MTQTLPLSLTLGSPYAAKIIGYTVLNLDRTEYAAFALATESSVAGTYYVSSGYSAPDAGGYLVVSESDGGDPAVLTAIVETDIESSSANVTYLAGQSEPVDNLVLALGTGGLVEKLNSVLEADGAVYRFTTNALERAPTGGAGAGSTAYTDTVTDVSSNPLDGVEVWITSDSGGASTVASTTTNTLGAFTVYLDPGTYYLWLAKGGYNFPNPTTITVT